MKTAAPNAYIVPPLLVDDLVTQCAAHFLSAFRYNSDEHVRDVVRCGFRGPGGLVDEVDYWCDICSSDAEDQKAGESSGWWDIETMGPWVYDAIPIIDIANAVRRHTRGWKAKDFLSYGRTFADNVVMNEALVRVGLQPLYA